VAVQEGVASLRKQDTKAASAPTTFHHDTSVAAFGASISARGLPYYCVVITAATARGGI